MLRERSAAALVLLGLASLIAVALARGRPDAAAGAPPIELEGVLDAVAVVVRLLGVVLVIAVAGMVAWAVATGAGPPRRETTWRLARRVARFVLVVYLVTVVTALVLPRWWTAPPAPAGDWPLAGMAAPGQATGVVWPLLVLAASVAVSLYGLWRLGPGDGSPAAAGREVGRTMQRAVDRLDEGQPVADVVVLAYQRMERLFSAAGVPRQSAETPRDYLARTLAALGVDPTAPAQLAALYERARFGAEPVDARERRAARAALARVAEELGGA